MLVGVLNWNASADDDEGSPVSSQAKMAKQAGKRQKVGIAVSMGLVQSRWRWVR